MTDQTENEGQADAASRPTSRFSAAFSGCVSLRWSPWLVLVFICLLAVAFRCLHLLKADHYYILSPDSYYFHRMADLVASGDSYYYPTHMRVLPYWLYSGLTYPVGLTAKVIAFVTGVAPVDAVTFVSKAAPPTIAVATIIVLWLVVSRMYGRAVAHLSAFAFAAALVPIVLGAAGYIDRDGISWLIILMGVSAFYLTRDVHFKKGGVEFGWVIRGASVLVFEAFLFVEWNFLGPVILLTVLIAYVLAEVIANLWPRLVHAFNAETDFFNLPLTLAKHGAKGMVPAIRESSYKPMVLVLALSAIVSIFRPGFKVVYNAARDVFHPAAGAQYVAELRGIGPSDVIAWQFLLVPLLVGLYVTIRKRRPPDILWLSWFAVLFVGGLFARRLYLCAAPAACVLCGIGLGAMLDLKGARRFSLEELVAGLIDTRTIRRYLAAIAAVVLIAATVLVSGLVSRNVGSPRIMAVTPQWQEALAWLRSEDNTPEDSKIMTWWDYGYWILDVAHRIPVVDNGVHWVSYDQDVARVYCTTDDAEAVEIMQEYGARYLVFSDMEIVTLPVIISEASLEIPSADGKHIPRELKDSLFARSLGGQIEFGSGLRRVYPAAEITEPPVVILALE